MDWVIGTPWTDPNGIECDGADVDCSGYCFGSNYFGCSDPTACGNYDPGAGCDDGSCLYYPPFGTPGCTTCGQTQNNGDDDSDFGCGCGIPNPPDCKGNCAESWVYDPLGQSCSSDALDSCGFCCSDNYAGCTDPAGLDYDSNAGCDGGCQYPSIFTNVVSDNLSDFDNYSLYPDSNSTVVIKGFVLQDRDLVGETGFYQVIVDPDGLICDGVTINTQVGLTNNSTFTGGYANSYYTDGELDLGVTGLFFNYYPPTGYALVEDGTTDDFFTGGYNGLYYVLGVRDSTFNGSAENYTLVAGALQHSTATFVNGAIPSVTNPGNSIFNLIGIPWFVHAEAPDVARIIGLPSFIKL